MPARRASTKRKAPEAGHAPLSSSKAKKRPVADGVTSRTEEGKAAAASPLATKFMTGVANHLASDDMGQDTAMVEGALRAAVSALPKGKLKAELVRDEALTVERLVAEVRAVKAKKQGAAASAADTGSGGAGVAFPGQKGRVAQTNGGGGGDVAARQGTDIVPCTVQLYGRARRQAEEESSSSGSGVSGNRSSSLLRSLALNPRAPLDLLVKAMGTDADAAPPSETRRAVDGGDGGGGTAGAALETSVDGMRNLVKALTADPSAALSASGVAFYAHRAADLAAAIAAALTAETFVARGGVSDGIGSGVFRAGFGYDSAAAAAATEGLGLMLRVLQLAGLAVSSAAVLSSLASDDGAGGGGLFADPAGALLLSCLPKTTATITAGAGAGAGGEGASAAARMLPPARLSVGRLLAHYAVAMAACSGGWKGGAAALVKGARSAAVVGVGAKRGDGNESSSSDSSSSDESDDDDKEAIVARRAGGRGGGGGEGGDGGALRRHLSALCAGHLSGNETATLEFLRCVGDAAFPQGEASVSGSGSGQSRRQPALSGAAAASLAPTCARALARLPRPSASPPPTAAFFLKRAYAFRVVEALGQQAVAPRFKGTTGAAGGRSRGGGCGGNASAIDDVRPWDFVGAAAAPVALLDFLGRPEAPLAVGGGGAGAALKELAARRRSPAAVAELLRSSVACAPASLGPLLSAMERLGGAEGDGRGEIDSGGRGGRSGGGGGAGGGGDGEGEVGGFFVDTGAEAGEGGAGMVLAPVGSGRGAVVDMEEEGREVSVSRDDMSASDEESDG